MLLFCELLKDEVSLLLSSGSVTVSLLFSGSELSVFALLLIISFDEISV